MRFFSKDNSRWASAPGRKRDRAFTLIEIMIVVAIMGIILATGIPAFTRMYQKEGMRKATSDMLDACKEARAQAILNAKTAELVIRPQDGTFSVDGGKEFQTSKIPDNVAIEILGVNFIEFEQANEARVKFYPNGTSDEFTIVFRDDDGQRHGIRLEVVTAIAELETDVTRWAQ